MIGTTNSWWKLLAHSCKTQHAESYASSSLAIIVSNYSRTWKFRASRNTIALCNLRKHSALFRRTRRCGTLDYWLEMVLCTFRCPVLVTTSGYAVTAFRCYVCVQNLFEAITVIKYLQISQGILVKSSTSIKAAYFRWNLLIHSLVNTACFKSCTASSVFSALDSKHRSVRSRLIHSLVNTACFKSCAAGSLFSALDSKHRSVRSRIPGERDSGIGGGPCVLAICRRKKELFRTVIWLFVPQPQWMRLFAVKLIFELWAKM